MIARVKAFLACTVTVAQTYRTRHCKEVGRCRVHKRVQSWVRFEDAAAVVDCKQCVVPQGAALTRVNEHPTHVKQWYHVISHQWKIMEELSSYGMSWTSTPCRNCDIGRSVVSLTNEMGQYSARLGSTDDAQLASKLRIGPTAEQPTKSYSTRSSRQGTLML